MLTTIRVRREKDVIVGNSELLLLVQSLHVFLSSIFLQVDSRVRLRFSQVFVVFRGGCHLIGSQLGLFIFVKSVFRRR